MRFTKTANFILFCIVIYVLSSRFVHSEDSKFANLNLTVEKELESFDARITDIEDNIKTFENRLNKLESHLNNEPKSLANSPQLDDDETKKQSISATQGDLRYTAAELNKWVRDRYNPNTTLTSGLMAKGQESLVWRHLTDSNHGFSNEQVSDLEMWVALALHDASHANLISPIKNKTVENTSINIRNDSVDEGSKVYKVNNRLQWDYNGKKWSSAVSNPYDGQRFASTTIEWYYENGKMYVADSTVTQRQTAISPMNILQQGSCANGNCSRRMLWRR